MHSLTALETDYQVAKERLKAAQQEKLEATAEFLSIRAVLRQTLETLWPVPCSCGETGYEKMEYEKDMSANWV